MRNPDPEKFHTLPQAFDVIGRARFPNTWTGKELKARDLPPPYATFRRLKQAKRELEEKRAEAKTRQAEKDAKKVAEARRASAGVRGNRGAARRPIHRPIPATHESDRPSVEEIARCARVNPYVVEAAADERAYRREHRARWRRNAVKGDIRRILYDLRPQPMLQNFSDGRRVKIPRRLWFADEFTVEFDTGEASWMDIDMVSWDLVYRGLVLIERVSFDRAVRGEPVDEGALGAASRKVEADRLSEPPPQEVPAVPSPKANQAAEEVVATAPAPKWWPKTPETQESWRKRWKCYEILHNEHSEWGLTSIANKIAREEFKEVHGRDSEEVDLSSPTETIRKHLGIMRKFDGPPPQ